MIVHTVWRNMIGGISNAIGVSVHPLVVTPVVAHPAVVPAGVSTTVPSLTVVFDEVVVMDAITIAYSAAVGVDHDTFIVTDMLNCVIDNYV
jgi:hypothetical protein